MKKLMTILLAAALAIPALGQSYGSAYARTQRYDHTNTEYYFGLRLGLNAASVGSDDADMDYTSRAGLNLGLVYGVQLTNSAPVWLELGLSYSEKGGCMDGMPFDYDANGNMVFSENGNRKNDIKMRMSYLEMPIVCKYSFDLGYDCYIQPFVGGYLAVGITGKTKEYGPRIAYKSFDTFDRFDGGLRFGCGVEYQILYAELGMAFGLADISKDDFASAHTQNFFLNVGVNF